MAAIDYTTGVGPQIRKHLDEDLVVWLTTTSSDGTPQPNPVWFITDGDDIIVYSHRTAARNHNIRRNNRVSLNFNSDPEAEHMSVITGTAAFDETIPPPDMNDRYMAKYGHMIPGIGMTPETYAETFSVALRITPTKIRGW